VVGFLDFETTGLSQEDGHRFIECALMLADLDTGAVLGKVEQRLNPQRGIDEKAQAVHHIAFEDLIACPLWDAFAPKLAALLGKCNYVVAHNGEGFDIPFMYREFIRVGIAPPVVNLVDTMLSGRWATADGAVPNLKALAWACDVPYDTEKAHAAMYDVEVMKDCFFAQYPRGFFKLPTAPFVLQATVKKGK
jgi:DNA polymerase-3 subunit epsilon